MKTARKTAAKAPNNRFVILGLPRSGTTYLMTLLNAHPRIHCSGEQFNPYAIVGIHDRVETLDQIVARDRAPLAFMNRFFARHDATGDYDRVGFKFMIGHNARLLRALATRPHLRLIYVHRENRLAQASSLVKALESQIWAQSHPDDHVSRKIEAGPRRISQIWHEYETYDTLFAPWFKALPHRKTVVEYRQMFKPDFNRRICRFLGVPEDPKMQSPLVKQSSNTVLDRFENPEKIEKYFTQLGLERWLEDEIQQAP